MLRSSLGASYRVPRRRSLTWRSLRTRSSFPCKATVRPAPSLIGPLNAKGARFARTGLRGQAAYLAVAGATGAALGCPGPAELLRLAGRARVSDSPARKHDKRARVLGDGVS
jgi:hypothetical protein